MLKSPTARHVGSTLVRRRCYSTENTPPPAPLVPLLLQLAVPIIPIHGFCSSTLSAASTKLPPPHTPPPPGFAKSTIDALFPSRLPSERRPSKTREELLKEMSGEERSTGDEERLGPATALLEEWLVVGREKMVEHVVDSGKKGEDAIRVGLRRRLRYNEDVLAMLPAALSLLSAKPSESVLAPITSLVPLPSPAGYLEHVARIAHDLALASGDESQGVAWYRARARLATVYAMSEIHLTSPKNAALPHDERMQSTFDLVESLLTRSDLLSRKVKDAELFANWIVRSWMGFGRSMGV